jgi:hypothetical protein
VSPEAGPANRSDAATIRSLGLDGREEERRGAGNGEAVAGAPSRKATSGAIERVRAPDQPAGQSATLLRFELGSAETGLPSSRSAP